MWPMLVVVGCVAGEDCCQVPFAGDEHVVGALASGGADPAFGVGVGSGCLRRCLDDRDADSGEYGVEGGGELGVAVAQQKAQRVCSLVEVDQ
jgi:hypothetical protein